MNLCKRHFLDYVAESNCSTSISVGDTYTIVADYEFSRCQECASDAGELIYSDEWEQACHRGKEPAHPVEWASGFNVITGYHNGHVAKAQIQAGSLQDALESTKDYWDDPQFQSMKITRAIMGSEEE